MDILHEALVALNDWVEDGCPKDTVFDKRGSICINVGDYISNKKTECPRCEIGKVMKVLKETFYQEGLHEKFPFNEGIYSLYESECYDLTVWQNPQRLAWLKKHGRRTISDCIPLFSKTPNPEISIIINVYQKNGMWWAIPDVWRYHKQLGVVKVDDNSLRHQIYLDLNAKGVAIEGYNDAL